MQDQERPNELEIQTPCPKTWDSLVGDGRKRFCSECNLHVHNSAALTSREARELVEHASERVCMRIVRDASGAPLYLDSREQGPGSGPVRSLPRAAGWFLAAGAALLSACHDGSPVPGQGDTPGPIIIDPVDGPKCPPDDAMGIVAPEMPVMLGEVGFPVDCDTEQLEEEQAPSCERPIAEDAQGQVEVVGRVALPPRDETTPE